MKPISCHRADISLSRPSTYEMTINLRLKSFAKIDTERLRSCLQTVLTDEVRHFEAQLFFHGLQQCMAEAFSHARDAAMQELYGDARVPYSDGSGWVSRWCLESEKLNSNPLPYRDGAPIVTLHEVPNA